MQNLLQNQVKSIWSQWYNSMKIIHEMKKMLKRKLHWKAASLFVQTCFFLSFPFDLRKLQDVRQIVVRAQLVDMADVTSFLYISLLYFTLEQFPFCFLKIRSLNSFSFTLSLSIDDLKSLFLIFPFNLSLSLKILQSVRDVGRIVVSSRTC